MDRRVRSRTGRDFTPWARRGPAQRYCCGESVATRTRKPMEIQEWSRDPNTGPLDDPHRNPWSHPASKVWAGASPRPSLSAWVPKY